MCTRVDSLLGSLKSSWRYYIEIKNIPGFLIACGHVNYLCLVIFILMYWICCIFSSPRALWEKISRNRIFMKVMAVVYHVIFDGTSGLNWSFLMFCQLTCVGGHQKQWSISQDIEMCKIIQGPMWICTVYNSTQQANTFLFVNLFYLRNNENRKLYKVKKIHII